MLQRFHHMVKTMYGAISVMALMILLSACMASCGGGIGSDADVAETASENAFDSILSDSALSEKEKTDSADNKPVVPHLRSKEEIIAYIENSPDRARYEAGIIPTMAEYVPEYASKLLANTYEGGFLIVDKNTMKLYRYDKYGVEQERVGIACAKNYGTKHKKGDSRTPEGFFSISGIFDSTDWLFTDDDGKTSPAKGQFGPRYMRVANPASSQIGIHGTAAPWSIGGRRSHGCIRMTNENIMRIHKLCGSGMPVIVSPGPRDMAVNESEGYDIPSVPVVKGGKPCKAGKYSDLEKEKTVNNESHDVDSDSVSSADKMVQETHERPSSESSSSKHGHESSSESTSSGEEHSSE